MGLIWFIFGAGAGVLAILLAQNGFYPAWPT